MKVIKIGAVWCNGCNVMRPRWQEIEKENPWLTTQYYDFDMDKQAIADFNISSGNLPVFIFQNKDGEEITRLSGEIDKEKLIDMINQYKDK